MQVIKGNIKRTEIDSEEQIEGRMKEILWVKGEVKGDKEDDRDVVVTLVNFIAESGELLKLDIVFPDQKDREEN